MTTIKLKGFKEYLADDPSLKEKFTYEEFLIKKNAVPAIKDVTIEDAFNLIRN